MIRPGGQKLFHIVAVPDPLTDGQTDTHFESPWTPKGKINYRYILCICRMGNLKPRKISTISIHETLMKIASLPSLVKDHLIHT